MDAVVYWIATSEEEIHFIDAIISAYDGMASVRRDFEVFGGKVMYKIYVSPGMEDEFLEVVARLRETAAIGELIRDDEQTASDSDH